MILFQNIVKSFNVFTLNCFHIEFFVFRDEKLSTTATWWRHDHWWLLKGWLQNTFLSLIFLPSSNLRNNNILIFKLFKQNVGWCYPFNKSPSVILMNASTGFTSNNITRHRTIQALNKLMEAFYCFKKRRQETTLIRGPCYHGTKS